jgi:hypothetical protein
VPEATVEARPSAGASAVAPSTASAAPAVATLRQRQAPAAPAPRVQPVARRTPAPAPKTTIKRSAQEWATIAGFGIVLLAVLAGSAWWGLTQGGPAGPSTPPQFSEGSNIRVTVQGGGSVDILAKCLTGFSWDPVGVASDGDEGTILQRKPCNQEWWYEISIPKAVSAAWDGRGWIPGEYLKQR